MQIVIDMPDTEYQRLIAQDGMSHTDAEIVVNAFYSGIPLPKGHGRLIDEKIAYKKFYSRCLAKVATEVFTETPTIIEADAESEDKE